MKKFLLLLPCLIVFFVMSCDRRNSKSEHLKSAISEFNKNLKQLNVNSYYPEYYTEIKTDSIIASTFEVSLKNFTSNQDHILIEQRHENATLTQEFHRVFECDLIVSVADKIIVKERISADSFQDYKPSNFWSNATLEQVWVNQELSNKSTLSLGISFINPKTKAYKLYELQIDKQGNEHLMLREDHS